MPEWGRLGWPGRWNLVAQVLKGSDRPRIANDRKPIWLVKYYARQLAVTQATSGVGGCPSRGDCGPDDRDWCAHRGSPCRQTLFKHPGRGQQGHLPAAETGCQSMGRARERQCSLNMKVTKKEVTQGEEMWVQVGELEIQVGQDSWGQTESKLA